jgi:membrane protease YdiL (CAAX protease family)
LTFAMLAVTAGICEEVVFRGFGFAYVRFLWPGVTDGWLIVITSVVFGLAHLYQGPRGVLLTGLAGAVFASMTVETGSLLPAIAVHAMVDLRILGLPDLARDVLPMPVPPAVRTQPAD